MDWNEEVLELDPEKETDVLVRFIKEQTEKKGRTGAVLGLSGGIDSAVVATLAAKALGPENVLALLMPERDSSGDSITHAMEVVKKTGIQHKKKVITPILRKIGTYSLYSKLGAVVPRFIREKVSSVIRGEIEEQTGELPFVAGLKGGETPQLARSNAYYRTKHRVRMILIYLHAENLNRLTLGCSNYTEHATGYFVRYGDDTGDLSPIEHLLKMQVVKLAKYLEIPDPIIDKAPSPDLAPGVTDEIALGLPYSRLDVVLAGIELNKSEDEIMTAAEVGKDDIDSVRKMMERSEPKRRGPMWMEDRTPVSRISRAK